MTKNIALDRAILEARTSEIESSLLPWINQLVQPDPSFSASVAKGKSKSVSYLVNFLIDSVDKFVLKSNEIANEQSEMQAELGKEIASVKDWGNKTVDASYKFGNEPAVAEKRVAVSGNAQKLLRSVGRVLAIADFIDAHSIVQFIHSMLDILGLMRVSSNDYAFMHNFKAYGQELKHLLNHMNKTLEVTFFRRSTILKLIFFETSKFLIEAFIKKNMTESVVKNQIASTQAFIFKQSLFLYTSSRVG
jgi:hypothetical protein